MILSFREYCGEEHYIWGRLEYDKARNYLKNCGKPKDWYDKWLIDFNKETCSLFRRFK